jgi:hypothetical protein
MTARNEPIAQIEVGQETRIFVRETKSHPMKKLLLFHSLLFTAILSAQEAVPPVPAKAAPTQWEYKVASVSKLVGEKEELAKLGLDGWELVSVVRVSDVSYDGGGGVILPHLRYYFKRLKAK